MIWLYGFLLLLFALAEVLQFFFRRVLARQLATIIDNQTLHLEALQKLADVIRMELALPPMKKKEEPQ